MQIGLTELLFSEPLKRSDPVNCPKCNIPLLITHRQEIEIDYCPQCRGIWLDRGELDKITTTSAVRETKWHEYFINDAIPLFHLKREKNLSWQTIRLWRAKATRSRRMQIDQ